MFKNFRKKISDDLIKKSHCYVYAAGGVDHYSKTSNNSFANSIQLKLWKKVHRYEWWANVLYKRE